MSAPDSGSIPVPAYFVRRRKYDGVAVLIARQKRFQLDGVADCVWIACDGKTSVCGIITAVRDSAGLSPEEARSATEGALSLFLRLGLVSFRLEAREPGGPREAS